MTDKEIQLVSKSIMDSLSKLEDDNLELEIRIGKKSRYKGKDQFKANLQKKLFLKIEKHINSDSKYWDSITVSEFFEYKLPKGVRVRTDRSGQIIESNKKKRILNKTFELSEYREDLRVSLSKELPVTIEHQLDPNLKPFTKRRTNYKKEFLIISLTKLIRNEHSSYQIEIEIVNKESMQYPEEYVINSCIEHIKFLLKNEKYS
jgi:hypothetical protein